MGYAWAVFLALFLVHPSLGQLIQLRKLLATSPFLGLATKDAKKVETDKKTLSRTKASLQSANRDHEPEAVRDYFRVRSVGEKEDFRHFSDFYTADSDRKVRFSREQKPDEDSHVTVDSKDEKAESEKRDQAAVLLMGLPVSDIFWSMIRSGDLPLSAKEILISTTSQSVHEKDYWNRIKSSISGGSFVEFGTGATSMSAALSNKEKTVISVLTSGPSENLQNHLDLMEEHTKAAGQENLNLCHIPVDKLSDVVQRLTEDYQAVFQYLLLSDLPSLVGTLLPHELEHLIGRLFSLSWNTFIVGPPNDKYFSYWNNLEHLVDIAAKSAGVNILKIIEIAGEAQQFGASPTHTRIFKVVIKSAERRVNRHLCAKKKSESGREIKVCGLFLEDEIARVFFSDQSILFSPVRNSSLPLQTVLDLNPLPSTLQKLLVSLTEISYVKSHSTRNVLISGQSARTLNYEPLEWKPETGQIALAAFADHVATFSSRRVDLSDVPLKSRKNVAKVKRRPADKEKEEEGEEEDTPRSKSDDDVDLNQLQKSLDALAAKVDLDRKELLGEDVKQDKGKKSKPAQSKPTPSKPRRLPKYQPVKSRPKVKPKSDNAPEETKREENAPLTRRKGSLLGKILKIKEKEKVKSQPKGTNTLRKRSARVTKRHLLGFDFKKILPPIVEVVKDTPLDAENAKEKTARNSPIPTKKSPTNQVVAATNAKHELEKKAGEKSKEEEGAGEGAMKQKEKEKAKEEAATENEDYEGEEETESPTVNVLERLATLWDRTAEKVKESEGTAIFDAQWRLIHNDLDASSDKRFSVLAYGGPQQGLLATKVARTFPKSTVVTVFPLLYANAHSKHRALVKNLRLNNTLTFQRDFSPAVVSQLNSLPDLFRYQFLGIEVFQTMATMGGDEFAGHLGQLLALARTTYLEIPYPHQLITAVALLRGRNLTHFGAFRGFIFTALESAGVHVSFVSVVKQPAGSDDALGDLQLLKITISRATRSVSIDCSEYEATLVIEQGQNTSIKSTLQENSLYRADRHVSLAFLLKLDLVPEDRQKMLLSYLALPVYEDMCPLHILWSNGRLVYSSTMGNNQKRSVTNSLDEDAVIETLKDELAKEKGLFSFVEFESHMGEISLPLARTFPESSFVSLESNKSQAHAHYKNIKAAKAFNNIVGVVPSSNLLIRKLLESPDFFRFQFLGIRKFLDMVKTMARKDFNDMLGGLFATGMTSFIQIPSSEVLSLAASTFFPSLVRPFQSHDSFTRSDHPISLFKHFEVRMAAESARAEVKNNVSATVLRPTYGPPDIDHSWRFLKIHIRNLTARVNHHFDYSIDGHSRKYSQRCVTNATHWQVYLVREFDGYKIPYESLHSISLIALLRMGLLPELREAFYDMFIRLPLYEDMAPWNIVFQGGKLAYIDYDTKDKTYNKMVPAAYQVMAMLMNYQRTVADFGHCKGSSRNEYGFPYISSCVESDFNGPCKDSSKPVPCGDHTCRSTYVECLQALNELEFERSVRMLKNKKRKKGEPLNLLTVLEKFSEKGNWAYGLNGYVAARKRTEVPKYDNPAVSWRTPD